MRGGVQRESGNGVMKIWHTATETGCIGECVHLLKETQSWESPHYVQLDHLNTVAVLCMTRDTMTKQ